MAFPETDLEIFLRPLAVDVHNLPKLAADLCKTYRHLAKHSTDQFLATPISVLPSGREKGTFLAIDLGGTNLRVAIIELLGVESNDPSGRHEPIRTSNERLWPIGEHLKMDNAGDLFMWIGDCIAEVVDEYAQDPLEQNESLAPQGEKIPLGITFSFPMIQSSISEATLMPMGKGFAITSNLDLAKLLLAGYDRHTKGYSPESGLSKDASLRDTMNRRKSRLRGLPPIEIAAITNDTVATLASLAYSAQALPNARVAMGLIVGTGTNATIPMKLKYLHQSKIQSIVLQTEDRSEDLSVVVNTEWTINGTAGPLKDLGYFTSWDAELDRSCEAPGFQPFEYMTAGRYLGELVRLIVFDFLTTKVGIAPRNLPAQLCTRNAITTTFLSAFVAKAKSSSDLLPELARQMPSPDPSLWQWTGDVALLLIHVSHLVKLRSAALIAAATVGLLASTGELNLKNETSNGYLPNGADHLQEELIVAYAGGTISHFPGFLEACQSFINGIVHATSSKNKRVVLQETLSGGIVGAAVLSGTVWNLPVSRRQSKGRTQD